MNEIQRYCVGTKVLVSNNDGTCVLFSDHERDVAAKVKEAVEAERTRLRLAEVDPLIGLVNRLLRIADSECAGKLAERVLAAVRAAQEKEQRS